MTGGIGGFFLASSLGVSKQLTGSYQAGLLLFAVAGGGGAGRPDQHQASLAHHLGRHRRHHRPHLASSQLLAGVALDSTRPCSTEDRRSTWRPRWPARPWFSTRSTTPNVCLACCPVRCACSSASASARWAVVFLIAALHPARRTGSIIYGVLIFLVAGATVWVAGRHVWIQSQPPGTVPACGAPLDTPDADVSVARGGPPRHDRWR